MDGRCSVETVLRHTVVYTTVRVSRACRARCVELTVSGLSTGSRCWRKGGLVCCPPPHRLAPDAPTPNPFTCLQAELREHDVQRIRYMSGLNPSKIMDFACLL